jgi:hypothetical protein
MSKVLVAVMDGDTAGADETKFRSVLREKHGATVYELDGSDASIGAWLDELRWKFDLVAFYQRKVKGT